MNYLFIYAIIRDTIVLMSALNSFLMTWWINKNNLAILCDVDTTYIIVCFWSTRCKEIKIEPHTGPREGGLEQLPRSIFL